MMAAATSRCFAKSIGTLFAVSVILSSSGCGHQQAAVATATTPAADHSDHDHSGHDHTAEGPHHGLLMELGAGEFHAELVRGRDWATVYILDATATTANPVDQLQILINVTSKNQGTQFVLKASPEKSDPANWSSRFVTADQQLVEALTSKDCSCRISLQHAGIPYGAVIPKESELVHKH
jgi:hypothetical protein